MGRDALNNQITYIENLFLNRLDAYNKAVERRQTHSMSVYLEQASNFASILTALKEIKKNET